MFKHNKYMVHECNINCKSMDSDTAEALGMEDPGRWLPFIIDLDDIYAAKAIINDNNPDCTGIFCYDTEVYMIDTPYNVFKKIFIDYKNKQK